jgi:putative protease
MEQPIGKISHYFGHLGVAALQLTGELHSGDQIHVKGHTTDFQQTVESLEVDHKKVERAGVGEDIAIKVQDKVRVGDLVFRVTSG